MGTTGEHKQIPGRALWPALELVRVSSAMSRCIRVGYCVTCRQFPFRPEYTYIFGLATRTGFHPGI